MPLYGIYLLNYQDLSTNWILASYPNLLFLCGFNEIQQVPDEISFMTNLFCIFLKKNQITGIPASIPPIERIYFDYNKLSSLPNTIFHSRLEKLSMPGNPLWKLSPLIGNCKKLMHLEYSNTGLTEIPVQISECQKLRIFSVTANNIPSIPAPFVQLVPVVNEIRLDDNPHLTTIPYQPGFAWGTMTATISISKTGINVSTLAPELQKRIKNDYKDDGEAKFRDMGFMSKFFLKLKSGYLKWFIIGIVVVILLLAIIVGLIFALRSSNKKKAKLKRKIKNKNLYPSYSPIPLQKNVNI